MWSLVLLAFSFLAHAEPPEPFPTDDEKVLFVWDHRLTPATWAWVEESRLSPTALYARWDRQRRSPVWVTADNRDPIAPGSAVQGYRFGMAGDRRLRWLRLEVLKGGRELWRTLSEPPFRPMIFRFAPFAGGVTVGIYISEMTSGKSIESQEAKQKPLVVMAPRPSSPSAVITPTPAPAPAPVPKPVAPIAVVTGPTKPIVPALAEELRCTLEVSQTRVPQGGTILVTMRTQGPVETAMLEDAAVDHPYVVRAIRLDTVGRIRISGWVYGKKKKAICEAYVDVIPN